MGDSLDPVASDMDAADELSTVRAFEWLDEPARGECARLSRISAPMTPENRHRFLTGSPAVFGRRESDSISDERDRYAMNAHGHDLILELDGISGLRCAALLTSPFTRSRDLPPCWDALPASPRSRASEIRKAILPKRDSDARPCRIAFPPRRPAIRFGASAGRGIRHRERMGGDIIVSAHSSSSPVWSFFTADREMHPDRAGPGELAVVLDRPHIIPAQSGRPVLLVVGPLKLDLLLSWARSSRRI